jgi:ferredoxin
MCMCLYVCMCLGARRYDSLPPPCEEEDDMLDLAFGLTETSRLGCQVVLDQSMDGLVVALPRATRNMAVDGYVPQPH